jgi:hypothetical protein
LHSESLDHHINFFYYSLLPEQNTTSNKVDRMGVEQYSFVSITAIWIGGGPV